MRKILIVGAGQAGLLLALGLQSRGYETTVMSPRTPDEIRNGRLMSTPCVFGRALRHERELGLDLWAGQAPRIEGVGISVAAPAGTGAAVPVGRAVDWLGRLDAYAQSVDQRVKTAGWLETFVERGGRLVLHGAVVAELDRLAVGYDLVLIAAGRGGPTSLFARDVARSPYETPQRALAVSCVYGLGPRAEHPDVEAVRGNLLPGAGELVVMPSLTTSGRCDVLCWEAIPGGPLDVFDGITDPSEHLAVTLDLMERYTPWEYARARRVELTDDQATLSTRVTPVVRDPVGRLPGGTAVLGVADAVVTNDPLTGQGANLAADCATSYLDSIVARGELPFDEKWMRRTFGRYWESARRVTRWTNTVLAPLPPHVFELLRAAERSPAVADRIANSFDRSDASGPLPGA